MTQMDLHPIERAIAAISSQPVVAADTTLGILAQTRGQRSAGQTALVLDVLAEAIHVAATGTRPESSAAVPAVLEGGVCDELACAALLRLLVLDEDAFGEDIRLRGATTLFDRRLGNRIYPALGLAVKQQAYEKRDGLRSAVSAHETAIQLHIDSLKSLDALPGFRQRLNKLYKDQLSVAFVHPFLPRSLTEQTLNEVIAAAQRAAEAADSELRELALTALARCDELSEMVSALPTQYATSMVDGLAVAVAKLLRELIRGRGLADPANLSIAPVEKTYPLGQEGSQTILRLRLVNDGPGHARDVVVTLDGHSHLEFADSACVLDVVPSGALHVDLPAQVVTATQSDATIARIEWVDPDGTCRESELLFEIEGQTREVAWEELGYEDPYPLEPVALDGAFVGRESTLRELEKIVLGATPGNARVAGERRVGKTSVALALSQRVEALRPGAFHFIHLEAGDFTANTPGQTIERLASMIFEAVRGSDPRLAGLTPPDASQGLSTLTDVFRVAQQQAADLRFVVVLDEFDAIPHPELYDRCPLGDAFFQSLRSLGGKPNVGFVIVGGERMRFVIADHGQELNKFQAVSVDYFDGRQVEDYRSLVADPVSNWIALDNDSVQLLFRETAGNPWITKLVARELFDQCVRRCDSDVRVDDMKEAITSVLPRLGVTSFQHFWDDGIPGDATRHRAVSLARRKILLAIATCLRSTSAVTRSQVTKEARRYGVDEDEAAEILRDFREREIVQEDDDGQLLARVPLFFRWLTNEGVSEIIVSMPEDQDALMRRQRAEELRRPRSDEIQELTARWRMYQGRIIDNERVRGWLNQFGAPSEQRLMLNLLQGLRYFTAGDTAEHLRDLHRAVLRDLAGSGYTYTLRGQQRYRNDLVVCGLEGGGSGAAHLVRPYRNENGIYSDRAVDSDSVRGVIDGASGGIRAVVILEDFLGTGNTARDRIGALYRKWTALSPWPGEIDVYLAAVCGFDQATQMLREALDRQDWNARLLVSVELDDADRCFNDRSRVFREEEDRVRARAICVERGALLEPKHPLGYGGTEAAVCFEARCPNNTLPVLWKDGHAWRALFPRL